MNDINLYQNRPYLGTFKRKQRIDLFAKIGFDSLSFSGHIRDLSRFVLKLELYLILQGLKQHFSQDTLE